MKIKNRAENLKLLEIFLTSSVRWKYSQLKESGVTRDEAKFVEFLSLLRKLNKPYRVKSAKNLFYEV